jgi:hypothetical protein
MEKIAKRRSIANDIKLEKDIEKDIVDNRLRRASKSIRHMLTPSSPSLRGLIISSQSILRMVTPPKGQHFFNGSEENLKSYKNLMKSSLKLGNVYIYMYVCVCMYKFIYKCT